MAIAACRGLPDNEASVCPAMSSMSQRIFFAHANGFPSATYRKLFDALAPEYRVTHMDRHGHDPRFPVDDNWNNLLDELFEQLERLHDGRRDVAADAERRRAARGRGGGERRGQHHR